ncbi:hypothetical protein KS4_23800 [Poriferisphaera corsica]|uniref:Uncharacterized protein n=1 Tax=Poriferisphaera corsica TaxID=2528020 RepID=A0A517YVU2_9BACT|nr:hypothetical protein [Poriferisphaera corsica]QDU34312.1 hypothetical protein KS4_23800 [Poriferisphaera corsica]
MKYIKTNEDEYCHHDLLSKPAHHFSVTSSELLRRLPLMVGAGH